VDSLRVNAVGGGHHPIPSDQTPTAGVIVAAAGQVLERDLRKRFS